MKELAILLRAINLYAHSAHNLCGRVPFFQDHEFFLELYQAADSDINTSRALSTSDGIMNISVLRVGN